jgi:hypothetical protein
MAQCLPWIGENALANANALAHFGTDCSFIMTGLCQFLMFFMQSGQMPAFYSGISSALKHEHPKNEKPNC